MELVAPLQLLDDNIFAMLIAGLPHHSLVKIGIKRFTLNPHRCNPELLEDIHQLLVETLVAAVEGLRLLTLGIELLASAIEIINNRQYLAQGVASDLQAQVFLIAGLSLAVIVEICRNAHVLRAEHLVLALQGCQLHLSRLLPLVGGGGRLVSPLGGVLGSWRIGSLGGRFSGGWGLSGLLDRFRGGRGWGSVAAHAAEHGGIGVCSRQHLTLHKRRKPAPPVALPAKTARRTRGAYPFLPPSASRSGI